MGNNITVAEKFGESKFKPNSVILITGASSGLGEELAYQYAKRRVRLFLCARNLDKLNQVADKCKLAGSKCEVMKCDVTKEEECKQLVEKCIGTYGELDVVILNAGINAHVFFEEVTDLSIYDTLMKTNYYGYLYVTKYAFPYIKRSKGQFVVISSASGVVGIPMRTAYCASKFAVTGFFESLRQEIEEQGYDMHITLVCPSSINTPMREKDIVGGASKSEHNQSHGEQKEEKRMSTEDAVKAVMIAADQKIKRVYIPNSFYLGVHLKPFFANYVDRKIREKSRL